MKVLLALSATLILFFSPLEVLGGGCIDQMATAIEEVDIASGYGTVTALTCMKVGKGYSVLYERECANESSAWMTIDVYADGGFIEFGYGSCQLDKGIACAGDINPFSYGYASTAERNADKRSIASLCGMLPLDDAPVCQ